MNLKGIFTWLVERIPPPAWVGTVLMYFVCQKFTQYVYTGQAVLEWVDIFGSVAVFSFIVLIRCLDEHKDFKDDSVNYPDRPVQRGVVTLNEVTGVAVVCVLFQLVYSLVLDGGWGRVCWLWALSLFWLFLMTKEFFVEKWLRRHVMTYLFTHQIITPLMVFWILQTAVSDQWVDISKLWPVVVFVSMGGLIFELTRKTWGPEEEREGVDSYARALGIGGAIIFSLVAFYIMVAALFALFQITTQEWMNPYAIILGVLALPTTAIYLLFWCKPSKKGRKANEGIFALASLTSYILALVAIF